MRHLAASLTSAPRAPIKVEEPERYLPILAAAHELLRQAAKTADEAREIEKGNDTAARLTHFSKGETRKKTKLGDKFEK